MIKKLSQHAEWLSLVEISGPFLTVSTLESAFPQGLESLETPKKQKLRGAYYEWREAVDEGDELLPALHNEWIQLVLKELLEFDSDSLSHMPAIVHSIEHSSSFKADLVVRLQGDTLGKMLIKICPPNTDFNSIQQNDGWNISFLEKMTQLCRSESIRLGLLTNGEQWMVINAPAGTSSGTTSWYSRLWFQESCTLKAFQSLLSVRRFFGPSNETLEGLLDDSLKHHEEVTDTLGEQVRRAVEVLVQCLDKADQDRNRELLEDVNATELYEAGLTVMMRLVFVLCAEERGLLLLGDSVYDQCYAVSTIRAQLAEDADRHGPEVLDRRHDAWARLLAIFRAVYGGVQHETFLMPALGGSLFDPDRFPFLEGRKKGTKWLETNAVPLPIDNRTVLLLMNSLQILEQSGGAQLLSYRALDVEQIGHVYEGLLENTVIRVPSITMGLTGSQKAKNPNIPLSELESARFDSEETLIEMILNKTVRSRSAVTNALKAEVCESLYSRILGSCGGDQNLAEKIKPFAALLRTDAWGDPIVYLANSFMVTHGADRRETGTHYTPKSLTETIVSTTLEPVIYVGPAEGRPQEEWILKSSTDLLSLKVCDPAMGSGAFLVQACRYLSDKLVDAWTNEERNGFRITIDGICVPVLEMHDPLPSDIDERRVIARRLVAERCLYGVDINPLAVELAKLSLWLTTMSRGRPFGFLDHNLRSGDSLMGIYSLEQLFSFDLHADERTPKKLFAQTIDEQITEVITLRKQLRETPIRDIQDIQYMERLDLQARQKLIHIEHIADAIVGEALVSRGNQKALDIAMDKLSTWSASYIEGDSEIGRKIISEARASLSIDLPAGKAPRKPFHWVLEFPEVFEHGGFNVIIGNPPFVGGQLISGTFGNSYLDFIVHHLSMGTESSVDLVVFFFLRAYSLLNKKGCAGLIARRSLAEGKNKDAGLRQIIKAGGCIFFANTNIPWPGNASVVIHKVVFCKTTIVLCPILNGTIVKVIADDLTDTVIGEPYVLSYNSNRAYQGTILGNEGFKIEDADVRRLLQINGNNSTILAPFIGGNEVNRDPYYKPMCSVINFWDWGIELAENYAEALKLVELFTLKNKGKLQNNWWLHLRARPEMYDKIGNTFFISGNPECKSKIKKHLERVIVISTGATKYPSFTFLPPNYIYSNKLCVIVDDRYSLFAILSSEIHSVWAWLQKTSMGADLYSLVYAHGNIFYTFPFPENIHSEHDCSQLSSLGKRFFNDRQAYMERTSTGLTSFYNKFHSKDCEDRDVISLRLLQIELTNCTLTEYGWSDIDLEFGFHAVGYLPLKNSIRFTISENARVEVLKRLLNLNHKQYGEETSQELGNKYKTNSALTSKKMKVAQPNVTNLNFLSDLHEKHITEE